MVKFYLLQIKMGNIVIDDVPSRWRAEVEKMLGN